MIFIGLTDRVAVDLQIPVLEAGATTDLDIVLSLEGGEAEAIAGEASRRFAPTAAASRCCCSRS